MLPDVAWLPTAMIVLITIFAWVSGRLEFPIIGNINVCGACYRFPHNDFSDSGAVTDGNFGDVISLSAFYEAVYSLIVNQMARTGLLYRFINESLTSEEDNLETTANYLVLYNNESKGLFGFLKMGYNNWFLVLIHCSFRHRSCDWCPTTHILHNL